MILLSAFALRMAGLSLDASKDEQAAQLNFKSFQVLSCAAPLIWMKLVRAVPTLVGAVTHEVCHSCQSLTDSRSWERYRSWCFACCRLNFCCVPAAF